VISTFGFPDDKPVPGYTGVRDETTVLAATCAIRHALSIPDALLLLEVIGIDAPPLLLRCGQCGNPPACADHKRTCAPRAAERVMRLADSIGGAR
jgi:hypothetical protein